MFGSKLYLTLGMDGDVTAYVMLGRVETGVMLLVCGKICMLVEKTKVERLVCM